MNRAKIWNSLGASAITFLMLTGVGAANAQCRIHVVSTAFCNSNGAACNPAANNPHVTLRVLWQVTGTPRAAYQVVLRVANQQLIERVPAAPGFCSASISADVPIPGAIPYSVTIDPGKVSGAAGGPVTKTGTFTLKCPETGLSYYSARHYTGYENLKGSCLSTHGIHGIMVLGVPTTGSFQTVLNEFGPSNAQRVTSGGAKQQVWVVNCSTRRPTDAIVSWNAQQRFDIEVRNAAINPAILSTIRWNSLQSLTPDMLFWTQPDSLIQSGSPIIAAFIARHLPADYKTAMSPYTAALTLFKAIVKRTVYDQNVPDESALTTLVTRRSDCTGFSTLFAACMRSLGVPARALCGILAGHNERHCLAEFYLPGAGWIPADGAFSKGADPTGAYAYFFGNDPLLNTFCEISRATKFRVQFHGDVSLPASSFYCSRAIATTCTEQASLIPQ